jgi:glucan biosynthesis protein C
LSMAITFFLAFLFPWGMPFFFLLAGAGSWFALRRRTAGQFAAERFKRLFVPYVAGCVLLWPIMLYFEWRHITQKGAWLGSFRQFVLLHRAGFSPMWFGEVGFHLWFLGFLFCFSLIALPLFLWLKGDSGRAAVSRLAGVCARRGGILLFILPLLLVRLGLHPLFPEEHDWADFWYLLSFFVLGYVLFAHAGFTQAIRRDWPILLTIGIITTLAAAALGLAFESLDLEAPPRTAAEFVFWSLVTVNGWCWTTFMLFVGIRYLDFSNKWLQYGQEAVLPFFVFHQPVIIAIAFYVVQWDVGIGVKMLAVVLGSFLVTIGIYELLVRRVAPLRALFGMKTAVKASAAQPQAAAPASRPGIQPSS